MVNATGADNANPHFTLPVVAYHPWVSANGPLGASAYSIVKIGSDLYVGVGDGGVYKSTDGGDNWSQDGLFGKTVNELVSVSGMIYAGTLSNGLYAFDTTQPSNGWVAVTITGATASGIYAMTTHNSTLYVGLSDGSVYSLVGSTWTKLGADLPASVRALYYDDATSTLYAGTYFQGLYRYAGSSWDTVQFPGTRIQAIVKFDGDIYAAVNGQAYKSATGNSGSWTVVGADWSQHINAMAVWNNKLVESSVHGTYELDSGNAWQKVGTSRAHAFGFCADGTTLYAATVGVPVGGVFKYTAGDADWQVKNNGLTSLNIADVAASSGAPYAYAASQNAVDKYDGMNPWSRVIGSADNSPISISKLFIASESPGKVYAGNIDGTVKSFEQGPSASWQTLGSQMGSQVEAFAYFDNNVYVGLADGKIEKYQSSAWVQVGATLSSSIKGLTVTGGQLYAATQSNGVYVFNSGTSAWDAMSTGLPAGNIVGLVVLDNNLYVAYSAYSNNFYMYNSIAATWQAKAVLPMLPYGLVSNTLDGMVAYGYGKAYKYTAQNDVWFNISSGLPSEYMNGMAIGSQEQYAATSGYSVYSQRLD
jgi:hypothetical protein